jgi:hypothetical protein
MRTLGGKGVGYKLYLDDKPCVIAPVKPEERSCWQSTRMATLREYPVLYPNIIWPAFHSSTEIYIISLITSSNFIFNMVHVSLWEDIKIHPIRTFVNASRPA